MGMVQGLQPPHLSFFTIFSVADTEGGEGPCPHPGPVKISHKKDGTKGGCIDFMFLCPPYPTA